MTFIIRSLQLLLFFMLLFSGQLSAQVVRWKTYTSVGSIRDIEVKSGVVWAATYGGVLQINIDSGTVNKFTNTEGLSANDVIAVEIDKRGSVWFGLANGDLNRYFPSESRWKYFEDFKNQEINDIKAFGDSLYIALDIGVSLFLIDKEEVKETYRNFGLSSGNEVTKVSVRNIFIEGSDIWVSTDKGLARSNLNFSNLQAPASWTIYTDGAPTQFINQLI